MKSRLYVPGILEIPAYAEDVGFSQEKHSHVTVSAVRRVPLSVAVTFGWRPEHASDSDKDLVDWIRSSAKVISEAIYYADDWHASWGVGQAWTLEEVKTVPDWVDQNQSDVICTVIRILVSALDETGFGWQKKERILLAIESGARRAGVGRLMSDQEDMISTHVWSIRRLIAAGQAEDRGTLGPEPK